MENTNIHNASRRSNRALGGVILVIIGLVILLQNMGFYFPGWLFSWNMFLIVLGVFIGIKRNFRGAGWLILVILGSFFTMQRIFDVDISRFFFPLMLTGFGIYLILKPKKYSSGRWRNQADANIVDQPVLADEPVGATSSSNWTSNQSYTSEDVVDSVSVFSGTHKNVFSKNLKGGDIVAVFGGCDLNLTQADFQGTVVIDVVVVFGGVKIVVPPSWKVRSEMTALFGGLEDKTSILPYGAESNKTVVLRGFALFGGVDIKNF